MSCQTVVDQIQRWIGRGVKRRMAVLAPLAIALAALPWCKSAMADDQQAAPPAGSGIPSYQDLLYLRDDRPIVIRLHLVVDGQPFASVWQAYVQRLFTLADRDGDENLSLEETQSPVESDDALREELSTILTLPGLAQADLSPPDGVLSFGEFAAFVRRFRGGPFQPPPVVTSVAGNQPQTLPVAQSTSSGRILFNTLDVDEDGRISSEELRAGSESIRKLDFDGDGASSIDELDHLRGAFGRAVNNSPAVSTVPLRPLSPDLPTSDLIQTVVSAYGGAASRGGEDLSIAQLGYEDDVQFAEFDADDDGRLDRDELRYWLTHPRPHVELVVRIGKRADGEDSVVVTTPPTLDDLTVRTTELGLVSLVSGDVHLEIGVGPDSRNEESVRQSFTNRFQQSDRDGNGYLERDEVAGNRLFEESFNRYDRNGDGMVFEEEMFAVVEGRIIASLSSTSMATANRGKDLFEILDTNRDQRVSRRELLAAVNRFDLWDVDEDGKIAEGEVPQLYQLVFDRGTPQLPGFNMTAQPVLFTMPGTGNAAPGNGGPVWFQKMDRNGDGDVSRREFVGTPRQFDRLDADGNDLIDAMEGLTGAIAE